MTKKLRRTLLTGLMAAGLTAGGALVPAAAVAEELGGWSEDGGTFSSGEPASSPSLRASPQHSGQSQTMSIGGTTHKRSYGLTTWAGTRHYTTAQLEHYWPASGVIASSGRIWGVGRTEAATNWVAFNPNAASNGYGIAKTYYGN